MDPNILVDKTRELLNAINDDLGCSLHIKLIAHELDDLFNKNTR